MKRLGTILHVTPRGSIIVRSYKTPPLGGIVLNSRAETIGKIVDVFGPVKQPYVSVRPLTIPRSSRTSNDTLPLSFSESKLRPGSTVYVMRSPSRIRKAPKRRR